MHLRRSLAFLAAGSAAVALSACAVITVEERAAPALPASAEPKAARVVEDDLGYVAPVAPAGPALPPRSAVLTSIAFGSCNTAERPIPILDAITAQAEEHDMFLYIGDNVYGDVESDDPEMPELRNAYAMLAARPEFQRLRSALPMEFTWDDHDYGLNDAGGEFALKTQAQELFNNFWRVPADDERRSREGVYTARMFGPEGRRVQIILLDTRYFRGELTPTDERGAVGKERYLPSEDESQTMLGDAQWAWLEAQLREPADLRLVVSSIQVHADGHGWEAWRALPHERERLYGLVRETGANGVVFVSGDRHSAGLYVREDVADYPLYEITSSSLNLSFRDENNEPGPHRLGEMYARENFGVIEIDWDQGELELELRDIDGEEVREVEISLAEIGAL